ncbi:PINORESINOL REDUCTASE-RELATED [Salix purpurea]|uniref:PINORESINOL REDUCTASE-RELATED n=1 Tax=Salix purpurea TaxID=77065 RepID=A0A9Q0W5T9_SALPP|nr:PINORESINOL REDUCTASE-RELATED [Salix purpurea]
MVISAVGGASIADQVKLVNAIEAAGTVKLPWPYHDNTHHADALPPLDRLQVYAYFVAGSDIGKLAIKSIVDNRTLNKTVHFRPPSSLLSTNELASLWEEKLGYKPPRVTITEGDLLADARGMRIPQSIVAAITHDIFIKSCQINYSLEQPNDVEVCSLYPELPFRTLDE